VEKTENEPVTVKTVRKKINDYFCPQADNRQRPYSQKGKLPFFLPSEKLTKNMTASRERTVGLSVNINFAQVHTADILAGWRIVV
jgi:hypothetical protein